MSPESPLTDSILQALLEMFPTSVLGEALALRSAIRSRGRVMLGGAGYPGVSALVGLWKSTGRRGTAANDPNQAHIID